MKKFFLTTAIIGVSSALPAAATTITGWNLDNVAQGAVPAPGTTEVSTIFVDNDSIDSNGQIAYTDPEAVTPGLIALNDFYTNGGGTFDGCIRASVGGTECATGFQTGNRFKLQLTDTGAIDLVFDVDPTAAGTQGGATVAGGVATPGTNTYQVFGRAVNLTGLGLDSFDIQLGFGVGDGFTASTAGDGLSFAQGLTLGPQNLDAFTQYPFGLFGDAPTMNADLDGFFNDARSGFDVLFSEDVIASNGFYETLPGEGNNGLGYEDLFGSWLSRDQAPAGLLWDDDNDPTTDSLVMVWFNKDIGVAGEWQALRSVDENGEAISILGDPENFATQEEAELYFAGLGATLEFEANIEDLANLNLNFGIALTDGVGAGFIDWASVGNKFTLRLTSAVAPIPLPAGAPLLLAGIGMIGLLKRRRSS